LNYPGTIFLISILDKSDKKLNFMTQKQKISDILVIAGLAAFAYYKYSRLTREEKNKIVEDLRDTGRNIIHELIPKEVRGFIPALK